MCEHQKYYDISKEFGFNRVLFEDLTGDLEKFLSIQKECTDDCKKMKIEIVEKTLGDFTTIATNYFKDAKIGIKRKDECSGINYFLNCEGELDDEEDHEFLEDVEKAMHKMER
ncbi:hypothetical protein ACTFIT_008062 [Dictyostelium discoideum]